MNRRVERIPAQHEAVSPCHHETIAKKNSLKGLYLHSKRTKLKDYSAFWAKFTRAGREDDFRKPDQITANC
jgi:hypothetical protein